MLKNLNLFVAIRNVNRFQNPNLNRVRLDLLTAVTDSTIFIFNEIKFTMLCLKFHQLKKQIKSIPDWFSSCGCDQEYYTKWYRKEFPYWIFLHNIFFKLIQKLLSDLYIFYFWISFAMDFITYALLCGFMNSEIITLSPLKKNCVCMSLPFLSM